MGARRGLRRARFQLGGDPFQLVWHAASRWDRQQGRSVWRPRDRFDDVFSRPPSSYTREDVFNRDVSARLFGKANWGSWSFIGGRPLHQGTGTGPIEGTGESTLHEPEFGLDATWRNQVGERGDFSARLRRCCSTRGRSRAQATRRAACLEPSGRRPCVDTIHYLSFKPFFEPIFTWDWNQDGSQVTTLGGQLFIDGA